MRSSSCALRGSAVVVLSLLGAVACFSGCSSVGSPDEATMSDTGSMVGRVTTTDGNGVVGIAVSLWSEGESVESNYTYSTTTDQSGDYEFPEVAMDGTGSNSTTYEMYVNRTRSQATGMESEYTASATVVIVERGETVTEDVVLELLEADAGSPAQTEL